MNELYFVGAGGFGREVAGWASTTPGVLEPGTEIKGFLDPDIRALDGYEFPYRVVGDERTWEIKPNHVFACTIGEPELKRRIVKPFVERGARFINIINPTASVSPFAKLGVGCVFGGWCGISAHAVIGDFVTLVAYSSIAHDAVIGDYCQISAHCDVTGHAHIGEGVVLGSHAVVAPEAQVDEYAVVGAGSVVVKHVPARTTVFGVPAQIIWQKGATT
jgi:sugar O-acyltransferase (sialic acid O-acetyltransferase NeuD family)